MNRVDISFGGLSNVPEGAVSGDGEMQLMVNLRAEAGELVSRQAPEMTPEKVGEVNLYLESVKIHSNNGHRLGLVKGGRALYDLTDGMVIAWGQDVSNSGAVITDFIISGNVVTLYREKNGEGVPPAYVIWRRGEYVYLGELPQVPKLNIEISGSVKSVTTDSKYYSSLRDAKDDDAEDLYNLYVRKGFLDSVLDAWYNDSGFVDRAMFRVALRLFDGSYISYSPIYYTEFLGALPGETSLPYGGRYNFNWSATSSDAKSKYTARILGYKAEMGFDSYDLSLWQNIVVSVDVFCTGSIMMHRAAKRTDARNETLGETVLTRLYEDYEYIGAGEVVQSVTGASMFYKIAEYDLKGRRVYVEKDTSPSNLSTKVLLPDYASKHAIGGEVELFYNSRLHLGDVKHYLHKGYGDLRYWGNFARNDVRVKKMTVVTRLMSDEGEKALLRECEDVTLQGCFISPFITYPDARAASMDIYIMYETTAEESSTKQYALVRDSFDLTRHRFMDMAYSINIGDALGVEMTYDSDAQVTLYRAKAVADFFKVAGVYEVVYDATQGAWFYNGEIFHNKTNAGMNGVTIRGTATDGDSITFTLTEDESMAEGYEGRDFSKWEKCIEEGSFYDVEVSFNDVGVEDYVFKEKEDAVEHRTGVMRVAAVDNPFFFPTAQTYKFDASVVALASNAEAVSQGQFGLYPLFVFTGKGIWSMQVDASGKGAYVTQTPFSREVCSGAVAPISSGVAFLTRRGVMLISGAEVVELSQVLDGEGENIGRDQASLAEELYDMAGLPMLNIVPFREFLTGAVIAYNYLYNEIIVSNVEKGYSYVYTLDVQRWGMLDVAFNYVTNSYPVLVTYDNKETGSVRIEFGEGANENGVLFVTRPVKFSTLGYKRLRRAALRCRFTGNLNFYVLASMDGVTWVCISGKEFKGGSHRDLMTAMCRSRGYRFMALCVTGKISGRLSMAQLLVDDAFVNNMLR